MRKMKVRSALALLCTCVLLSSCNIAVPEAQPTAINPDQAQPQVRTSQDWGAVREFSPEYLALAQAFDKPRPVIDFTPDDFKLLLTTPIEDIEAFFCIDDKEKSLWMMGLTAQPRMGLTFLYGGYYGETPTTLHGLYIWSVEELTEHLPLGYTIEEVLAMPQWGETEISPTLYVGGYSGEGAVPFDRIEYDKDGLHYSFRTNYNNVFYQKEEHDRTVALIAIFLDPNAPN